jgi:hypothetical protein
MLQVGRDEFAKVEEALRACVPTLVNLDGLKVMPPPIDDRKIEHAAVMALMSLFGTWVKPTSVTFPQWR